MSGRRIAQQLIDYMETLYLFGGDHDEEQFKALPWERKFLRGAFASDSDSAISVGRGNGKSALVALLACSVVDPKGPLHANRRDIDIFGSAYEQARIVFSDILASLGHKHDLNNRREWIKQDTTQRAILQHKPSGARVRCHGSDPKRASGLRSYLALLDEPSMWETNKRDRMIQIVRTGLGKQPGSRLIALGTRPADDAHFFARMLKGSSTGYAQVHAADDEDPVFNQKTWHKANPSLRHLPSLMKRILSEAKDAKMDPDALASFRSLRLNMGTSEIVESMLLDPDLWAAIQLSPTSKWKAAGPYILGIDLGQTSSFSAAAGYWPETGLARSFAVVPRSPGLIERGQSDGVSNLWVRCWQRRELIQAGEFVSSVPDLLREVLDRWGKPAAIVCDRWRLGDLKEALLEVRFPRVAIVERGQGFRDGAEDVRGFRRAAMDRKLRPEHNLLLTSAMSEARTIGDPAGNHKLSKNSQGGRRARSRDDCAAALILAVAEAERRWATKKRKTGQEDFRLHIVR